MTALDNTRRYNRATPNGLDTLGAEIPATHIPGDPIILTLDETDVRLLGRLVSTAALADGTSAADRVASATVMVKLLGQAGLAYREGQLRDFAAIVEEAA